MELQGGDYVIVKSIGQAGLIRGFFDYKPGEIQTVSIYFEKVDGHTVIKTHPIDDLEKIDPPLQPDEVIRRQAAETAAIYREVVDGTTDLTPDARNDKIAPQSTEESP